VCSSDLPKTPKPLIMLTEVFKFKSINYILLYYNKWKTKTILSKIIALIELEVGSETDFRMGSEGLQASLMVKRVDLISAATIMDSITTCK
jgi:hypothetical protein